MIPLLIRPITKHTITVWSVIGLAALLMGFFIELTGETLYEEVEPDELGEFDLDSFTLRLMQGLRRPGLTVATIDLTALGSTTVLAILCVVLFLLAWMKADKIGALQVAVGAVGAGVLTKLLKYVFERERPDPLGRLIEVHGYSYPSGHSLAAAGVYFTLALVACRYFKTVRERAVIFGIVSAIVSAIGLSRIYLGVHYPTDVVAGICVGMAWAFLLAAAFMQIERTRQKSRWT